MEGFDLTFERRRKPGFDQAPAALRRRVFDVGYLHLRGLQGGDLLITRAGWPFAESLLPDQWFVGKRFCKVGRALAGATGAVYRVPVERPDGRSIDLVVKFSRFAQNVNLTVLDAELHADRELSQHVGQAQFLSPFEEFGNLTNLRSSRPTVRTAQPLAIYSPPTRHAAWELGRSNSLFNRHRLHLLDSQITQPGQPPLTYDPERIYIMVYHWIEGIDAEQACDAGMISESAMQSLTEIARQTILESGWIVLDHKPRHVIVRPTPDRQRLVQRHDLPIWAIIDYELLIPRR